LRIHRIGSQFLFVKIYVDLFLLLAITLDIGYYGQRPEAPFQPVKIVIQLFICQGFAFQSNKNGRGFAKLTDDHQRQYSGRQLGFEFLQVEAEVRIEIAWRFLLFCKIQDKVDYPLAGQGVSLFTINLFIAEDTFFQWDGQLFFHLLR